MRWDDGDDPHCGHCTYSLTQVLLYIDWGWIEGQGRVLIPVEKNLLGDSGDRDRELFVKGDRDSAVLTPLNGLYYFAEHLNLQY